MPKHIIMAEQKTEPDVLAYTVACFPSCQLDQHVLSKKGQKQGLELDWGKLGQEQQVKNKTSPWQA